MDFFWGTITVLGYLLTLSFIPWVLLAKRQQPTSTVAWILMIVFLPFLGCLLFLIFGANRVERRAARKLQATRALHPHLPVLSQYQFLTGEARDPVQQRLMRVAQRVSGTVPTIGNKIELLSDTNRTFGLIEQAILSARETLHLEYYIWQPDRTGTRIRDRLIEKAREGVTVRFLFDGLGSLYLTNRFLKPMRDAGIHVSSFLPGASFRERWSINLRNHRKIVIADGRVGFTGGVNVGDEYVGRDPYLGYWRDTHLRLYGPCVLQLQQVFAEDWYYATGERLTQPELFPEPGEPGTMLGQVLAGGPEGEEDVFHALMFTAINEATERVTLVTSYFVPPASLVAALQAAAYRGVLVQVMVSGRSEHQFTIHAGRFYYETLLKAGVEIYEYTGGLMHSKTLAVDGTWALVGTTNFDTRSLYLNFEVGVAVYGSKIAGQLEDDFERDRHWSRRIELDSWTQRPLRQVLSESVCRLLAPVL